MIKFDPPPQFGRPVLSVSGHHSAKLVTGQRRSGCQRALPRRQEGGRSAEEADRESNVSYRRDGGLTDSSTGVWAINRKRTKLW